MGDKELAAVGIGTGVGHRKSTGFVLLAVLFIGKAVSRPAASSASRITCLDHEVRYHAVESRVVIETFFDKKDKIVDCLGGIGGKDLQFKIAAVGLQSSGVLFLDVDGHRGRGGIGFGCHGFSFKY